MKKKQQRSFFATILSNQIWAVLISIFLIGSIASPFVFNFFYQAIVTRNQGIAISIANRLESLLEDPIHELILIESIMESEKLSYKSVAEINELLVLVNDTEGYFESIERISNDGKVINTFPEFASKIGFDRSLEDFVVAIQGGQKVYWSDPVISNSTLNPTITIAIRTDQGMIIGSLDLMSISEMSQSYTQEFGKFIHITITDIRGVYLINENMAWVLERRINPLIDKVKAVSTRQSGNFFNQSINEPMIMTVSTIPLTGWFVSVSENYYHGMQGVFLAYGLVLVFLLLIVLLFIVLSIWTTRKIVSDISNFTAQSKKIADGDLEYSLTQQNYSEFEELAGDFKKMITNIHERDQRLVDAAYFDRLTGFHNRTFLNEFIFPQMTLETKTKFGLIYLDIDNFKNINDTFGHYLGDQLLIQIGLEMRRALVPEIALIRLGGDEFALVVPMNVDENDIDATIDKLFLIASTPMNCEGRMIYFSFSMGISIYPKDGTDIETLMRCADIAMYDAKRKGKDDFVYFESIMNQRVEERLHFEQQLRPAIENNEFFLEFQPQYSMDLKSVRGFEALIRWNSPILGRVNPADFIAVAEESRLILKIDEWVVINACNSIRSINEALHTDYVISINVSPVELRDSRYADHLIELVRKSGIKPQWLEIEITENISIDFMSVLIKTINTLREFGISASIDDFGTGYSSLSYVHSLPIDILKIDRTFIKSIEVSTENKLMIETILLMAHKMGLKTIAEGVETSEQHEILVGLGCDYIQGYYSSRPIPLEKLMILLEELLKNERK